VSALLREETVKELYDVRLILEPAAAAKAAVNRTEADILALRRARAHFRVAHEMQAPVWEADIEFHQAIAAASGNSVLARILAPMSDLLRHARKATNSLPAAVELALQQHDDIAIAIEEGSPARASRAMTAHMQSAIWAISQLDDLELAAQATGAAISAGASARETVAR
jgi:DNA-binding FadR family transcriptional regulator